jgi:hypothetical protein
MHTACGNLPQSQERVTVSLAEKAAGLISGASHPARSIRIFQIQVIELLFT